MLVVQNLNMFSLPWDDSEGTTVNSWTGKSFDLDGGSTHFGFVLSGQAKLATEFGEFPLCAGGYFSLVGRSTIGGEGEGLVVSLAGYRGFFTLGGPIEDTGRLRYIDGCSDSVLISPPKLGDPCLNFLHVPPGVDQTAHTHPSIRVGIIVSGRGICRHLEGEYALTPGDVFILPRDVVHSFHTVDSNLRIVVYHPDSDCGPSDDAHPMVNRTLVQGISASQIPQIRTQEVKA